jgi:dTDP-4-amino-4,6-dideoxygalactose transaminase
MGRFIVPRYDYAAQIVGIEPFILSKIASALAAGRFILSAEVAEFESLLAAEFRHREVIGVNSGTDALVLSLMGLGIQPGDEVILPANTFHATASAVAFLGAKPKLVDVDAASFLMNPNILLAALTDRVRAVIFVHLYGKCVSLSHAAPVLRARNIAIIEDAAQAHGSVASDGTYPGQLSDTVCYSFHPSKNLAAAGDAGAIGTNRADVADRLRILRSLGQKEQNIHVSIGLNSKLDALQAIVLSAKLPFLRGWNVRRAELAESYRKQLASLPVQFQSFEPNEVHTYHLLQIRITQRDELMSFLREAGIDAVIRYPTPIHLQPAFINLGHSPGDFPVAEALANELLALPLFPSMATKDVDYVCAKVHSWFERNRQ